jgi:D-alanine-D-alanine ligase
LDFTGTDLVIPALHGGYGEDGHLQAILDLHGIPYVFSGPLACAIAMDKAAAKRVMAGAGIATPDWLHATWDCGAESSDGVSNISTSLSSTSQLIDSPVMSLEHLEERAFNELGYPLVIKLNDAGSSIGVMIVERPDQFASSFARVVAAGSGRFVDILFERYVAGREFTAAVLLGRRLPLLEIQPHAGFYDYGNKYTRGASEYLVPAPVHSPHYENMCSDALRLYDLLGCQSVARVDFRYDGKRHYCLEINIIPGLTELSLVPMAARAVGISFEALLEDICCDALMRAERRADH